MKQIVLILSDYMYTAIEFRVAAICIRTQSRGMVWFIYGHRIFVDQYTSYLWNTESVSLRTRYQKRRLIHYIPSKFRVNSITAWDGNIQAYNRVID